MMHLLVYYILGSAMVLCGSGVLFLLARRFHVFIPRPFLYTLIVLAGYLLPASLLKYQSLHVYADLAHWTQVVRSIVTTGLPLSLNQELIVHGTLNYFSAHFVPFIYLIAPIFAVIPNPQTLLVINVLIMLSSAFPLYRLAHRRSGDTLFALFVAALLLWYPTFQYITLYEFEMLRFSIPALLWMLYFWDAKRMGWYWATLAMALLVREEVGLTVMMFGVYLFFFERKRMVGALTALAGGATTLILLKLVMPTFSSVAEFAHVGGGIFGSLGTGPFEVVGNIVQHPITALSMILNPIKIGNLAMLFLPLVFISFAAPAVLVGAVANMSIVMLSSSLTHSSYFLYYVAPTIPFIFYAFIQGWPRIVRRLERWGGAHTARALTVSVLGGLFIAQLFFGSSPLSLQFWFDNVQPAPFRTQNFHWSTYRVTRHHRAVNHLVEQIPDSAVVSAQQFLHPRLFTKRAAMVFPQLESQDGTVRADYVFLDTTNNGLKPESPAYAQSGDVERIEKDPAGWTLIASESGYVLYKRAL